MATATYEEADDRGTTTRRSSGTRTNTRVKTAAASAASALSTVSILELVERLGLVDMVIDRVKGRLEEVDIDEMIDEIGDYLKRNPEVLVVSLGAITIATGALVYLNKRNEESGSSRSTSSSGGSTRSTGSKSRSRS